jgi:hypothetical protein
MPYTRQPPQLNELHVTRPLPPSVAQIPNLDYIKDSAQQEAQITLALADLANQEKPNFRGTTRAFGTNCTTLYSVMDRILGTSLRLQIVCFACVTLALPAKHWCI